MPVAIHGLTIPLPNAAAEGNNPAARNGDLTNRTFWGRWALAADLPNATNNAASRSAYTNLASGDTAWAQSPTGLYVCIDRGTEGGSDAVWRRLPDADVLGTERHIYVDSATGDDSNDGSSGSPKETFNAAFAEVPTVLGADVFIHLVGTADYLATALVRKVACVSGSLYIVGDDVDVVDTGTFTGAVEDDISFTDSTKSWTVDEHVGRTLEVLGSYCTIIQNTATTLYLAGYAGYSFPAGTGETYQIFQPACRILVDPDRGIGGNACALPGTQPFDSPPSIEPGGNHNVILGNVKVDTEVGGFYVVTGGSVSFVAGVEIEKTALCGGRTLVGLNTHPILTIPNVDSVAGYGWGAHFRSELNYLDSLTAAGLVVRDKLYPIGGNTSVPATVCIISGRSLMAGSTVQPAVAVRSGSSIYLGKANGTGARQRFLVLGTGTMTNAIAVAPGASLTIGDAFHCPGNGWCTNAVRVQGGSLVIDINHYSVAGIFRGIDATTRAIVVEAGGSLVVENDAINVLAAGSNTSAIAVGTTPTLITTGAAGGLATSGATVVDAGSVVSRVSRVFGGA